MEKFRSVNPHGNLRAFCFQAVTFLYFFFCLFFKDLLGLTICFPCSAEAACITQAVLTVEIMMLSKCITKRKNFEGFQ